MIKSGSKQFNQLFGMYDEPITDDLARDVKQINHEKYNYDISLINIYTTETRNIFQKDIRRSDRRHI